MTVYYKATQPDGTDFYTGRVSYEVGTTLPVIEVTEGVKRQCCTATVYHASVTPSETLIGGSWPARLFEVEGEPVAEEGSKRGFATLKVVRELEAWKVFGPNGEAVVRLIEQAKTLTPAQAEALNAAGVAARNAAWYAAGNAARNAAWYAAGVAARNAAWDAAWYAAGNAARNAAWYAAGNAARNAAWDAAGDAAGNAALALVVQDLITPEEFHTLAGPWISVMGSVDLG
jgi:hypothetical protein